MASTKIRGITIELGADTSGLSKGLSDVNKEIGSTQKQLKDVERLLKLDPTNTELLAQKQKLLTTQIGNTKTKLEGLKSAQEEVARSMATTGQGKEQYDALTREIIACENELKKLENSAKNSNVQLAKIQATAKNVADKAGSIASAMTPATVAISGLGAVAVSSASDLVESQNKVDVAFGKSADRVKAFADTTLDMYGIARGTALDMSALFGDMATSMGLSQREASDMATSLTGLAGDLASFKNVSLDTASTALKGIFTGETESLKGLGVVMNETTLKAYAMQKGLAKNYDTLSQAQKVTLRYQYVLDATKNAQGDFANTADGTANSMRVMQESLKELSESFGQVLLPIITPIIQKITELIKKFGEMSDTSKKIIVGIALLIASIAPIAGIISGVATAISAVTTVMTAMPVVIGAVTTAFGALSAVMTFLAANPIVLVITAIIAGIIALGVAIYQLVKNWDAVVKAFNEMKTKLLKGWEELKKKISSILDGIKKNIMDWGNGIVNNVANAVEKVKEKWESFKSFWAGLWENIKVTAKGVWDSMVDFVKAPINAIIGFLNKAIDSINTMIDSINDIDIKLPQFLGGGKWSPNITNISNIPMLATGGTVTSGSAIVGEAGAELLSVQNGQATVQPLTNNSGASNSNNITSLLEAYLPYLAERQNLYLDGNALVGGTASRMNDALGRIAIRGGIL